MTETRPELGRIARRVALIYATFGALWILLSDRVLALFVRAPGQITLLQTIKGWFFIVITSWLLYALVHRYVDKIRRSEATLSESEEKYRSLVEAMSDFVWEVDENAVYTYASPAVRDILGYPPDEVVGKKPFDFMAEDEARRVAQKFGEIADKRVSFKLLENINIRADGQPVVLETSGTPIFDSGGTFRGYRGIDRDITERKRAEKALKERDRDIRRAYVDVFGAVTGGRLVLVTPEELSGLLGDKTSEPHYFDDYEDLRNARESIGKYLGRHFKAPDKLDDSILAANEAIANAIKHGGGGSYQVRLTGASAQIVISDRGPGIDFKTLPKATLLAGFSTKASLGMGFNIMLELADRVLLTTQPGNTTVVLEILFESHVSPENRLEM